jgi:hypothetical protein
MTEDLPQAPGDRDKGSVVQGIFFLGLAAGAFGSELPFWGIMCIGVSQLLWVGPLALMYRREGKTEAMKGVIIVSAVIALLNAACWGLMMNVRIAG